MARIFVATTGDDTFGTGTVLAPYRTIRKASTVWSDGDTIEVGEGIFDEVLDVSLVAHGVIRGAGVGKTIVRPAVPALYWIRVNDLTTLRLVVCDLTIDQNTVDMILFQLDQVAPDSRFVLARLELKLQDGCAVQYLASESTARVDLLNCVARSRKAIQSGRLIRTTKANIVSMRNTVTTRLAIVVDELNGGLPIDSDYNLFFENERGLLTGMHGTHDVLDLDPGLDPVLLTTRRGGAAWEAGVDLTVGYGSPERFPPEESSWGYEGEAPEIGAVETVEPSGGTNTQAAVISTLLEAFGLEQDNLDTDAEQIRNDKTIADSTSAELRRRFAAQLGLSRPTGYDEDQFRDLVQEMITIGRQVAPARRSIERIVQTGWAVQPIVFEHAWMRRFPIASDLKLLLQAGLTVRLTAGEVYLNHTWQRVIQTDTLLVNGTETLLYADGDLNVDQTLTVKTSTNLQLEQGWVDVTLTGTARFRPGQTLVVGSGTLFTSELARNDVITAPGGLYRYVVDEVIDDSTIQLRSAYIQDEAVGAVTRHKPIYVFGRVTTAGGAITAIRSSGYLGASTFLESVATHGLAVDVQARVAGSIDTDDDPALLRALRLLRLLAPVDRLVAFSYGSEYPAGKYVGGFRDPERSNVTYKESAEDLTWPTS